MRKVIYIFIVVLLLSETTAFAEEPDLAGSWTAAEILYEDVRIVDGFNKSSEITETPFPIALEIGEDNTGILRLNNTVFPAEIHCDEKGNCSLSIANRDMSLRTEDDGGVNLAISKDLIVALEKSDKEPDYSGCLRIEDILSEEEKQEVLRKKIEEAEASALAAKKPASVYDMHVFFPETETRKMSQYMNYGRYYLDDNTMIGMAYDKSGFLPNLVKCAIVTEDNSPKQEVFTVLDRHVNANFLTIYENQLYYVRVDRDSGRSSLARLDLSREKVVRFGPEMKEMAYLQIHDNRIWYTGDEHRLYSCLLNGKDNRVELDKSVYDPYFLTEEWLIYQDEEDGETLHIHCIKDGTDYRITASRAFNPVVDGTVLYFTSIPDDGGKAYLSRADLSKPVKEGELCYIIETSDLPMSKPFYIFDSTIYGENNSSVGIDNWEMMTNDAWLSIERRCFYVGDAYIVFGEMYSEHATVSSLYLMDRDTGMKSVFRHVY